MITVKDLLVNHLESTFEKETWQPPLATAVYGLTAAQAAWKPSPERHSIWQMVRHVLWWKRSVLQAWDGHPPDFEQMTREDWPDTHGDQAAWDADVQALHDVYAEFRRRLEALDDEGLQRLLRWYRQATQPQPVTRRLMHAFTHDVYHTGQIQYIRALQAIPADRLFTAAWDGNVAVLREVLAAHPDLLNAYNGDGWTALQIASYAGQTTAVRLLLERGADIHATSRNPMANTALHGAIAGWQEGGRADVVAVLLDHGANPDATDASGNSARQRAAKEGLPQVADLLRRHGGVE
jgi:uncharacterized damage-inducible protein DinB